MKKLEARLIEIVVLISLLMSLSKFIAMESQWIQGPTRPILEAPSPTKTAVCPVRASL